MKEIEAISPARSLGSVSARSTSKHDASVALHEMLCALAFLLLLTPSMILPYFSKAFLACATPLT